MTSRYASLALVPVVVTKEVLMALTLPFRAGAAKKRSK
jgi:hypothetical protein